ncbi:DUF881 domain-containing protein [Kitasatospora sp. NPDC091207]|uniref:DUF881 domain-containing protein n=1 Tax=Kitasatospora sp. NPDC091207 TaxID=3364083 RepID=UPI0038104CDB
MSSAPDPGREPAQQEADERAGEGVREDGSGEREAAAAAGSAPREPAEQVKSAGPDDLPGPDDSPGRDRAVTPEKSSALKKPSGLQKPEAPAEPVRADPSEERDGEPAEPEPAEEPKRAPKTEAAPTEPVPEAAAAPRAVSVPVEEPEPGQQPEPVAAADDRSAGRRRLKAALWPPRLSRGQLVVAVLLFSLGLALAIQVRSTNDHHSQLRGARQEDLVRILDELDGRQQRLQQEKAELEQSLAKLENSSNQAKEAQEQTRKKVTELGVLAGTVKATGPGIVLTVDDPQGQVKADMLLDTLQELRAAGAEAIQINDVRVVVNTYFTDVSGGGVQIDGKKVSQPYRFTVVGNPQDLTPALNIPGGVVRTLESHQARATISPQQKVLVDALVDLRTPQYAKPAPK